MLRVNSAFFQLFFHFTSHCDMSLELLLKYYGGNASSAPKTKNPMDINSSDFEAPKFFQSLVVSKDLSQLKREYTQLESDIQSLDVELQNMVYDNYTKFLKASEVVDSMTEGLQTLSSQMKGLVSDLDNIQKQTSEIRKELNPAQQNISRLVGISRLLDRIDFISRLPSKLRFNVELNRYEHAVDMWLRAEKILESQTHYESFVKIREECKRIIEEIKVKVRVKMLDEKNSAKESIECAVALIKLQFKYGIIIQELIEKQSKNDDQLIETIKDNENIFDLIEKAENVVVSKATEFERLYLDILLKYSDKVIEEKNEKTDEYIQSYKLNLFKKITHLFSSDIICGLSCNDFSKFLKLFLEKIGAAGNKRQISSFSKAVIQKYISSNFNKLSDNTIKEIVSIDQNKTINMQFDEIIIHFKTDVRILYDDFAELVKQFPDSNQYVLQLTTKLISRLINNLSTIEPKFSLLAFAVANNFSTKVIPMIFDIIAKFDPNSQILKMQSILQGDAMDSGQKCLQNFIDNKRTMFDELIYQGMQNINWLEAKTPHDANIHICLILQELVQVYEQLNLIFNKVGEKDTSSHSSLSSRNRFSGYSSSGFGNSQVPLFLGLRDDRIHQIDRLFTNINRLHLRRKVDIYSKSVLSSITTYTLKTMLELIRNNVFSCAGFNQMQVDAYFIYMTLFDKVDDGSLFSALIEELLSSAAERTLEPIPFKNAVLQEIYSTSESIIKRENDSALKP